MAEVTINESNFDQEVLQQKGLVLVDFWAVWCGPCKVLGPIVEQLSHEYEGKMKVGKVNVDENNGLSMRYGIMSIPTMKFFKDGQMVDEIIGAAPKAMIENVIARHL